MDWCRSVKEKEASCLTGSAWVTNWIFSLLGKMRERIGFIQPSGGRKGLWMESAVGQEGDLDSRHQTGSCHSLDPAESSGTRGSTEKLEKEEKRRGEKGSPRPES